MNTDYALDDPRQARDIVQFWKQGTASRGERAIIEAYIALDTTLRARLEKAFPALCAALKSEGY